ASLRAKMGDRAGALEALRLSFYVNPFEYAAHTEAGRLSLEEKQYAQALSEFQVTLALDPPNVAEANYNLATAYHLLGKQPEAKHAVLRALEAAPSYEKAQEVLLKSVGQYKGPLHVGEGEGEGPRGERQRDVVAWRQYAEDPLGGHG